MTDSIFVLAVAALCLAFKRLLCRACDPTRLDLSPKSALDREMLERAEEGKRRMETLSAEMRQRLNLR